MHPQQSPPSKPNVRSACTPLDHFFNPNKDVYWGRRMRHTSGNAKTTRTTTTTTTPTVFRSRRRQVIITRFLSGVHLNSTWFYYKMKSKQSVFLHKHANGKQTKPGSLISADLARRVCGNGTSARAVCADVSRSRVEQLAYCLGSSVGFLVCKYPCQG